MDGRELSVDELADRAGVTVRTVRYYISQGLLSGPGARGRAASYTGEHLARLRLIRRLAEQHVPLAEQRERLAGLSSADVRALLRQEEQREASLQRADATLSPRAYVAALLDRAHTARARTAPTGAVPARGPLPSAAPSQPLSPPPAAPALSSPPSAPPTSPAPAPSAPPPASAPTPRFRQPGRTAPAEPWQRWELAPGLELHARADVARRHAALIARLLDEASSINPSAGRGPGAPDAAFTPGGTPDDDPNPERR